MLKLYSSFPNGNEGLGLLLLRFLSGGGLMEQGRLALGNLLASAGSNSRTHIELIFGLILAFTGLLIIVGLWTSAATSVATVVTSIVLANQLTFHGDLAGQNVSVSALLFLAVLSTVLALLGPGALSADARLFGWKHIRFPDQRNYRRDRDESVRLKDRSQFE
jgi:putative oxidoreductase